MALSVLGHKRGHSELLGLVPLFQSPPLSPAGRERSRNPATVAGSQLLQAQRKGSQQIAIELHHHPPPANAAAGPPQEKAHLSDREAIASGAGPTEVGSVFAAPPLVEKTLAARA